VEGVLSIVIHHGVYLFCNIFWGEIKVSELQGREECGKINEINWVGLMLLAQPSMR